MPTAKRLRAVPAAEPVSVQPQVGYQILFDQASDAILAIRPDGKVDSANRSAEEMTGFLREELVGSEVTNLIPIEGKTRIPARARPLSKEILTAPGTYEDIAVVRKDGYVRLADLSVRIAGEGAARLTMAIFRDLTEKKQMERELITKHGELRDAYFQLEKKNAELQSMQETLVQAGKMAALGELAAGIAHEINQPLMAIRGYTQELQAFLPQDEGARAEERSYFKEIISNVDKMASIIGYLRAFVRKSVEQHEMVDVHMPIEEALKMLSRQFASRGISVEKDFGKLPQIYANPLQLEQVFINLATNARDAIEATGRGSGKIWIRTRTQGDLVEVVFKDDGCGMSDRTKTKAFNPFFTTKEVGKGMGLGLSLSYGMISKLHGSIVVESELGKGTAFTIRLPQDFREFS